MERKVEFLPAYDKDEYGIGSVKLIMKLKGEYGVVLFAVLTQWFLPQNEEYFLSRVSNRITCETFFKPLPFDLGYHSYKPTYEGQKIMCEDCELLEGKPCYYDGSTLGANMVFEALKEKGSDAVWEELEKYYKHTFGELK